MSIVRGKLRPIRDKVIVHNMHFGEQVTANGLVVLGDDGKDRGIHPRWGQVYAKGPENTEEYEVGDWILVEHGRWTRGVELETPDGKTTTIRMVELKSVLLWSKEPPTDALVADVIDFPKAVDAYRI